MRASPRPPSALSKYSRFTEHEIEKIIQDWQAFAQYKVFSFRGITPAAYALYSLQYFRGLLERSILSVLRGDDNNVIAAIIYESDDDAFTVHWAWTHHAHRNLGLQKELWNLCGITPESNVFITHLTVLSEKLADKYGWLYSPFTLYRVTGE